MKKNFKKNIAQKGGLMIEALAMLGLIAVVTPTMYKKSAERTLEVEDINTADTVRSYMGATEAYMAANYRGLIKEMTENEDGTPKENPDTVKLVDYDTDIKSYMPYGFQNDKSLYDYASPKIAIVRQGSNLSAFALFPAKSAGGLGQERTSRIASLIGANGGYIKSDKSAHGIGGVWNLKANGTTDELGVNEIFGSDNNNEFSLVTVSSNVINSASGAGEVENTKYLQRTKENEDELWRNTMRTDLYMGGGDSDSDPDLVGENSGNTDKYSILNINSLIVGAEKNLEHLNLETPPEQSVLYPAVNNGLYINPDGDNPDAYIGGTLVAAREALLVDENKLAFGLQELIGNPGEAPSQRNFRFEVTKRGDIRSDGDIALGDMALDDVERAVNDENVTTHMIKGRITDNGASLSLLSPEMFKMTTDEEEIENNVDNVSGTHLMIENTGFKGADNVEDKDSLNNDIEPRYTNEQKFPVVIGSNAMVKGVLSAGQVDAQHLRTASLSTGSEHIDDENKWLAVDKDGIRIRDTNEAITTPREGVDNDFITTGIYGEIKGETSDSHAGNIIFRTGVEDSDAGLNLVRSKSVTDNGDGTSTSSYTGSAELYGNSVALYDEEIGVKIYDRDIDIASIQNSDINASEPNTNPYRVLVGQGGNVDMIGANLKIMDEDETNILTVKGNTGSETTDKFANTYNDFGNFAGNDDIDYNITTHGNVLFSSKSKAYSAADISGYDQDDTTHFMAIGPDDDKAGVNIVEGTAADASSEAENNERVVFVDLSKRSDSAYVDTANSTYPLTNEGTVDKTENSVTVEDGNMNPGTLYIRKGLMEIVPDRGNLPVVENDLIKTPSKMGANEGSGIIRAGRFVANNINKYGGVEEVPDLHSSSAGVENGVPVNYLQKYNGKDVVRYDTYMVNPAYTSVMKDIKLTTRGGARLSDILPDFITKGIYLANNTFDDTMHKMVFKLENSSDGSMTLINEPAETPYVASSAGISYTKNNWASPYSGLVPAPQCPPGYGRVITITPFRFEMAQAGQLALSADAGYDNDDLANSAGYYVNTAEMRSKLKRASYSNADKEKLQNELIEMMPAVRELNVDLEDNGIIGVSALSGFKAATSPSAATVYVPEQGGSIDIDSLTGLKVEAKYKLSKTEDGSHTGDNDPSGTGYGYADQDKSSRYVLSLGSRDGLRPLVFQQSTWLHTQAVAVAEGEETYVGRDPQSHYPRGWAVLQGFLYHQSEYVNFACAENYLNNAECKNLVPDVSQNLGKVLWNLFPVAKNSLGSYVTTYCYFDRGNMWGTYSSDYDTSIERLDIINEVPTSYKKGVTGNASGDKARKKYYDQLNDPTMKYNEVW